jgi:hypothetical protein
MKIRLSVDIYKGVDGSSLSQPRCSQIVQVYEMLEAMGSTTTTYIGIQEEAERQKLFGKTKAKSAIRTFFPLLKKIDFVNYEGSFSANMCFTDLGTQFALICRALENVTDDTPHKDEVIERMQNVKRNIQRKGLINMFNAPECKSHNMWIALKLLKELKIIHWNEFLYTLSCIEEGGTIDEAIADIRLKKSEIDSIEFFNENGKALPTTCFTYLRSYLEEAGLISKISSLESKLLDDAELFYSQISL